MREPGISDAFGAALRACADVGAAARAVAEIAERDDGFINAHDMARYFAGPQDWTAPPGAA